MFLLVSIIALASLFIILLYLRNEFRDWRSRILSRLERISKIANTRMGPVEYVLIGKGPVLVPVHGGPGGFDQGLFVLQGWGERGFSILTFSRPGYLRTPLDSGKTIEEQADLIVALLDSLNIESGAILGASAGGPVSLQFALRYPSRIWALVMLCAISHNYVARESRSIGLIQRLLSNPTLLDIGSWLFDMIAKYKPALSLRLMFRENTTLNPAQMDAAIEEIVKTPGQVAWYHGLIRATCPLTERKAGLENDLIQLSMVPRYPLENIDCPVLVVHGTADADVLMSHAEFVTSTVPNTESYILKNVGHVIWLGDHLEDMNNKMLEFLNEHAPS
jgi:pimeloyl-ACP methyl ester carboxylesterase